MFTTIALSFVLAATPPPPAPMTDAELVNTVLSDPAFSLYASVFPKDSADIIVGLANGNTPLEQCAATAVLVCGAGSICSICVHSGPNGSTCSITRHDGDGNCPPSPAPCGPATTDGSSSNAAE